MAKDNNRIGDICFFQRYIAGNWQPWEQGTLRMWGQDFTEFESGPGSFPIGVVEDATGSIHVINVEHIRFRDQS